MNDPFCLTGSASPPMGGEKKRWGKMQQEILVNEVFGIKALRYE